VKQGGAAKRMRCVLLMGELPSTATAQVPAYSDKQCYTALVSTLADIAKSDRYDAATSQNADSLLSKWLERSTVMSLGVLPTRFRHPALANTNPANSRSV